MNENTHEDEIEIDLKEVVCWLRKKLWLIIIVAILTAAATFTYTKLCVTPIYTATTKLLVLSRQQSITSISLSDLQLGSQLTNDYMIIVKSRPVVEKVIQNLGLDITYEQMLGMISVKNPTSTRILEITTNYPDAYLAKQIVDEFATVSSQRIAEIMDLTEPNVVEQGHVPDYASSPNTMKNTIIAFIVGVLLTSGVIVVVNLFNDRIKSSEDIEKYLGLTTLGIIPIIDTKEQSKKAARGGTDEKNSI